MKGGGRRRTRSQWDEYYKRCHEELKRKKEQHSAVGGRAIWAPLTDDGEAHSSSVEVLRNCVDDDDDDEVEISSSAADDDDGVETLNKSSEDDAMDDVVEISSSAADDDDEDEEDDDDDDDYDYDEDSGIEILRNGVAETERGEGKTALETHGESRSDTKQGEERDGEIDQTRCNEHESDCEIFTGNVNEKLFRCRKTRRRMSMEREGGADLETDDEREREKVKEKLPKINKNKCTSTDNGGEKDGEIDQTRSNEHEPNCEIFTGNVNEKLFRCRKTRRRMNMEREGGDEREKVKEKLPKIDKNECASPDNDEGECFYTRVKMKGQHCSVKKVMLGKKRSHSARDLDFIKILVDSMNSFKDKQYNIDENALPENALPLRFRFEDEVVPPPEKSEWEEHIDSLFRDLELGWREIEADCTHLYTMEKDDLKTTVEIDESPAACCRRGNHHAILDEQIGIICKYCHTVIMDIKHVLPPFHVPTWERRDRRYYHDEFPSSYFGEIQFEGPASTPPDSASCTKRTVWDLVPGVKKELYPHQREGFEFMWRNIAGDTIIEKLKQTLADDARGCIISHAPGTGKTRLTIVFLQTFLKLYPACCPMILAPRGMLLTWEAEFKKWNFNVVFHNLNKKELSGKENAVAAELLEQAGSGILNLDCIRLLKLYSWARGGSILGVGYQLFEMLTGERNAKREQHENIREVLLERPGLLVLDEGHTPRNDRSQIWQALTKVSTQRRIILSGTPFQNNLKELYNTLCVVNPKFVDQDVSVARARWKKNLASSSGINRGSALKLRTMLEPYVHVHKGTVLEESLPGLRHTLVFLHPTKSQQTLLESACKEKRIFRMIRMVSLVSVHPSINAVTERYSTRREEITTDIDAGVKARFLFKLIHFADALGERVLVFSQFIDSLSFIKEQLESIFSWNEGREVLYMDGQLDERKRQESISCFNDETSEAKVLLASERACSEGINLIGASRVVLLDTVWNPSVEKQAICRAYRLGQKKIVYVYRLFTSGIEVRQYAQQNLKDRISQWLFSLGEGYSEKAQAVAEDKVLEAMLNLENFKNIFEKIISQPKESDLIKTFGMEVQN